MSHATVTPRTARVAARGRARRALEAVKLAAALAALAALSAAAFWTASDILAERDANPGFTFPACVTEDDPGPCYWDAEHRGNGQGRSFIVVDDVVTYVPSEGR